MTRREVLTVVPVAHRRFPWAHRDNHGLGVRCRSGALGGFPLSSALVKPVAVTVHFQDVDVVGQSIEQCPGQALGAEHLGPFVEWQVVLVTRMEPRS